MRVIEADAVVKAIDKHTNSNLQLDEDITCILEKIPTVEERKRGEWINHRNDDGHNIADCDQCGEAMQWFDDDIKPNFCPNCGAEMRGERDE